MRGLIDYLWFHTWWTYTPGNTSGGPSEDWYLQPYHWINLVEGCFWVGFTVAVLIRFAKHRRTSLELLYALAFLTFGLSDFREAYVVQSWLILAKGVNLAIIIYLRWYLIKHHYPQSKTF